MFSSALVSQSVCLLAGLFYANTTQPTFSKFEIWWKGSQCLNCEKRSGRTLEARRQRRRGGGEWGGGVPLPNRLAGLGERRDLPLAENVFGAFCGRLEGR